MKPTGRGTPTDLQGPREQTLSRRPLRGLPGVGLLEGFSIYRAITAGEVASDVGTLPVQEAGMSTRKPNRKSTKSKKLTLRKSTVRNLTPTSEGADKVRGGMATIRRCL